MKTFHIQTLGCKVNHYESEQIATLLVSRGLTPADAASADLRVINTCSVTTQAASQSRQSVRRMVRLPVLSSAHLANSAQTTQDSASPGWRLQSPASTAPRVIVTGCWATSNPADASALPGVTAVINHHQNVAEELDRLLLQWKTEEASYSRQSIATHAQLCAISPESFGDDHKGKVSAATPVGQRTGDIEPKQYETVNGKVGREVKNEVGEVQGVECRVQNEKGTEGQKDEGTERRDRGAGSLHSLSPVHSGECRGEGREEVQSAECRVQNEKGTEGEGGSAGDLRSLSPVLRGEGWGEGPGLNRRDHASHSQNAVQLGRASQLDSPPLTPTLSPEYGGEGAGRRRSIGTTSLPLLHIRQPGRQRAFLKIQDGCDAHCTYCIIPSLRPTLWSKPIDSAVEEANALVAAGHVEIVLTGIFLGAYGQPTALRRRQPQSTAKPIGQLIDALCTRVPGLRRLRLSSLEPGDLTDELLTILRSHPQVVPHFHLPLQSGSDALLRRMNRQYTQGDFLNMVQRVNAAFDRPALTTDVVVGFPGETDDEFDRTAEVVRAAGFIHVHAFSYSPRPGTAAARWTKQYVRGPVVNERIAKLREMAAEQSFAFRSTFLGETVEVIVERDAENSPGHAPARHGRCERYFPVTLDAPNLQPGDSVRAKISQVTRDQTMGKCVPQEGTIPLEQISPHSQNPTTQIDAGL